MKSKSSKNYMKLAFATAALICGAGAVALGYDVIANLVPTWSTPIKLLASAGFGVAAKEFATAALGVGENRPRFAKRVVSNKLAR